MVVVGVVCGGGRVGRQLVKDCKLAAGRYIHSGGLAHSEVITVNNTALYASKLLRTGSSIFSPQNRSGNYVT